MKKRFFALYLCCSFLFVVVPDLHDNFCFGLRQSFVRVWFCLARFSVSNSWFCWMCSHLILWAHVLPGSIRLRHQVSAFSSSARVPRWVACLLGFSVEILPPPRAGHPAHPFRSCPWTKCAPAFSSLVFGHWVWHQLISSQCVSTGRICFERDFSPFPRAALQLEFISRFHLGVKVTLVVLARAPDFPSWFHCHEWNPNEALILWDCWSCSLATGSKSSSFLGSNRSHVVVSWTRPQGVRWNA
jgi:hypothetical protein